MTNIKVNVSLINALAKDAKNNINIVMNTMMKSKMDFHQVSYISQQNHIIFTNLRTSEEILKYQDNEIDRMIEMSVDDFLLIKQWAEHKQIEYKPEEKK